MRVDPLQSHQGLREGHWGLYAARPPLPAGLNIQDLSQDHGGGSLVSLNNPSLDVKVWLSWAISSATPVCIWEKRGNKVERMSCWQGGEEGERAG